MTAKLGALLIFVLGTSGWMGCAPTPQVQNARPSTSGPTAASKEDPNSPEAALRLFLYATTIRDEEIVKQVTMPHKNLEVLWEGPPVPEEGIASARYMFATISFRTFKVGDRIPLPDGSKYVLDESWINEDRQQIAIVRDPFPFDLVRVDGKWKVNAAPMIEGRSQRLVEQKKRKPESAK